MRDDIVKCCSCGWSFCHYRIGLMIIMSADLLWAALTPPSSIYVTQVTKTLLVKKKEIPLSIWEGNWQEGISDPSTSYNHLQRAMKARPVKTTRERLYSAHIPLNTGISIFYSPFIFLSLVWDGEAVCSNLQQHEVKAWRVGLNLRGREGRLLSLFVPQLPVAGLGV